MKQPEFRFEMTNAAADFNWKILEKYNKCFSSAIEAQNNTQMTYGSEFKSTNDLELIFKNHPLWGSMKDQLKNGCDYPLTEINDKDLRDDVIESLSYGNHRGVSENLEVFHQMMNDEVEFGYSLCIPRLKILELPKAVLAPMNIVDQNSIDENGNHIIKKRLTHNQSMKFGSGTIVNSRVIKEELNDLLYGKCMSRCIHYIVICRAKHPDKRILMSKLDWKSAYRRSHLRGNIAIQTITQCIKLQLCFVALRLTFGGAPNPYKWSEISESVTDLSNALLNCEDWDASVYFSPLQSKIPSVDVNNDNNFAQALPLSIQTEHNNSGKIDCYIDDTTTIVCEINDRTIFRAERAALFAFFIVSRIVDSDDPINRKIEKCGEPT